MNKRCEAVWQQAHKVKGATTGCKAPATKLVVTALDVHRMCAECALKWYALSVSQGSFRSLGCWTGMTAQASEVIKAPRVKHALEQR